jgi:chromosome condensin MukBEF ATPase and DNA-binding subunit MukB
MDEQRLRDEAERDQLWASLRALLPEIERLAAGQWADTERERQLAKVLAGVVAAELRHRGAAADPADA